MNSKNTVPKEVGNQMLMLILIVNYKKWVVGLYIMDIQQRLICMLALFLSLII